MTNKNLKYLAPVLTFLLGFMPMLLFSIAMNGFWITSPYQFPLIAVPSVLFGDSILFPIFNYRIQTSLIEIKEKQSQKILIRNLILAFIFSTLLHSYSHYMWTQDSYTGFIDPAPGILSVAGWWHLGYSIVQSTIIFWFASIWISISNNQSQSSFIFFRSTWLCFVGFTIFNILGSIAQEIVIMHNYLWWVIAKNNFANIMPMIFSFAILGTANHLRTIGFQSTKSGQ